MASIIREYLDLANQLGDERMRYVLLIDKINVLLSLAQAAEQGQDLNLKVKDIKDEDAKQKKLVELEAERQDVNQCVRIIHNEFVQMQKFILGKKDEEKKVISTGNIVASQAIDTKLKCFLHREADQLESDLGYHRDHLINLLQKLSDMNHTIRYNVHDILVKWPRTHPQCLLISDLSNFWSFVIDHPNQTVNEMLKFMSTDRAFKNILLENSNSCCPGFTMADWARKLIQN